MKKAEIYIAVDNCSPRISEKKYGYVLECEVAGMMVTREGFGAVLGTYHMATLTAVGEALERFSESCEICIHAVDSFVLNMLEKNLSIWAGNEFVTSKGKPVANKEEWMKVWSASKKHLILTNVGKHSYSEWLMNQMAQRKE